MAPGCLLFAHGQRLFAWIISVVSIINLIFATQNKLQERYTILLYANGIQKVG